MALIDLDPQGSARKWLLALVTAHTQNQLKGVMHRSWPTTGASVPEPKVGTLATSASTVSTDRQILSNFSIPSIFLLLLKR